MRENSLPTRVSIGEKYRPQVTHLGSRPARLRTAALLLASRLRPRIDNVFQAASRKVRAAEEEVLQPIGDALPLGHQSVGHPVRGGLGIVMVVL